MCRHYALHVRLIKTSSLILCVAERRVGPPIASATVRRNAGPRYEHVDDPGSAPKHQIPSASLTRLSPKHDGLHRTLRQLRLCVWQRGLGRAGGRNGHLHSRFVPTLLPGKCLDDIIVRTKEVQPLGHRAGGAAVAILLPAHGLRDKQQTHHLDVGVLRSTMQRIVVVPEPSPPGVHGGKLVGLEEGSDLLAAIPLAQGGLRGRPEELGDLRALRGMSPGLLVECRRGLLLRLRILNITAVVRFHNGFVRRLARILRVVAMVQCKASASALQERRKSGLVATIRVELLQMPAAVVRRIAVKRTLCRPNLELVRAGMIAKPFRNLLTSILLIGGSAAIENHHRRHGRYRRCSKSRRAGTRVRRES
mmetsp:Transcript_177336/g.568604  ORF Transcript_177336/g.568604 Transcript_177336/m.568604 type:complete len:364 (-) Transcript_177336:38-1129(-)